CSAAFPAGPVSLDRRAFTGGSRLQANADLSLLAARFCELSIARVVGVQNRSFVLGPGPGVRWGPLACVVSGGWRLGWHRARRACPDRGPAWFRPPVAVAAAAVARGRTVTPRSGGIQR